MTTELPPNEALAPVLADPAARIAPQVKAFLQGPLLAEVQDVTHTRPAWFASAGGSLERRLLSATRRDHATALLSLFRVKDGGAFGVVMIGAVQRLPGPAEPPPYNGLRAGAGHQPGVTETFH
jgi:hypothetical protein